MSDNYLAVILAQPGIIKLLETMQFFGSPFVKSMEKVLVAKAEKYAAIQDAQGKVEVAKLKGDESRIKIESKIEIDRIKADAKAALTIATSPQDGVIINPDMRAELEALAERTQSRFVVEEVRRQINMESIAAKAAEELKDAKVSEKPVEADWTATFFDSAKDVSNDEMQTLWAKILAGEVANPGSFNRRTLAHLKVLTKREADLFSRLCRCAWNNGESIIMWDLQDQFFQSRGLTFGALLELEATGLMHFEKLTGFALQFNGPAVVLSYFGSSVFRCSNQQSRPEFVPPFGGC